MNIEPPSGKSSERRGCNGGRSRGLPLRGGEEPPEGPRVFGNTQNPREETRLPAPDPQPSQLSTHTLTPPRPKSPQDYPLAPLEEDCTLLRTVLDEILEIECGEEITTKVPNPQAACTSAGPLPLRRQIGSFPCLTLLVRAAAEENQDAGLVLPEPPRGCRRGKETTLPVPFWPPPSPPSLHMGCRAWSWVLVSFGLLTYSEICRRRQIFFLICSRRTSGTCLFPS